jgi:hypothetical protein
MSDESDSIYDTQVDIVAPKTDLLKAWFNNQDIRIDTVNGDEYYFIPKEAFLQNSVASDTEPKSLTMYQLAMRGQLVPSSRKHKGNIVRLMVEGQEPKGIHVLRESVDALSNLGCLLPENLNFCIEGLAFEHAAREQERWEKDDIMPSEFIR